MPGPGHFKGAVLAEGTADHLLNPLLQGGQFGADQGIVINQRGTDRGGLLGHGQHQQVVAVAVVLPGGDVLVDPVQVGLADHAAVKQHIGIGTARASGRIVLKVHLVGGQGDLAGNHGPVYGIGVELVDGGKLVPDAQAQVAVAFQIGSRGGDPVAGIGDRIHAGDGLL